MEGLAKRFEEKRDAVRKIRGGNHTRLGQQKLTLSPGRNPPELPPIINCFSSASEHLGVGRGTP